MTRLTELADRYESLPELLREFAAQEPGAYVVRNDVGNLAIIDVTGRFVGWIDVLTGEVEAA